MARTLPLEGLKVVAIEQAVDMAWGGFDSSRN